MTSVHRVARKHDQKNIQLKVRSPGKIWFCQYRQAFAVKSVEGNSRILALDQHCIPPQEKNPLYENVFWELLSNEWGVDEFACEEKVLM